MSTILYKLGLDPDDFNWWNLAACNGMDTNLFYDKYEADTNIAKSIDQCCLACPVAKHCYASGVENSEYGVWGGVYLNSGSIDNARNIHKTDSVWKQIRKKNGTS